MMKSTQLSEVSFELVEHHTWLVQCPSTDEIYMLFLTKVGIYYEVVYCKLVSEVFGESVSFPFPVIQTELYRTKVFLREDYVPTFVFGLVEAIFASGLRHPSNLPYLYGGVYQHQAPTTFTPTRTH